MSLGAVSLGPLVIIGLVIIRLDTPRFRSLWNGYGFFSKAGASAGRKPVRLRGVPCAACAPYSKVRRDRAAS